MTNCASYFDSYLPPVPTGRASTWSYAFEFSLSFPCYWEEVDGYLWGPYPMGASEVNVQIPGLGYDFTAGGVVCAQAYDHSAYTYPDGQFAGVYDGVAASAATPSQLSPPPGFGPVVSGAHYAASESYAPALTTPTLYTAGSGGGTSETVVGPASAVWSPVFGQVESGGLAYLAYYLAPAPFPYTGGQPGVAPYCTAPDGSRLYAGRIVGGSPDTWEGTTGLGVIAVSFSVAVSASVAERLTYVSRHEASISDDYRSLSVICGATSVTLTDPPRFSYTTVTDDLYYDNILPGVGVQPVCGCFSPVNGIAASVIESYNAGAGLSASVTTAIAGMSGPIVCPPVGGHMTFAGAAGVGFPGSYYSWTEGDNAVSEVIRAESASGGQADDGSVTFSVVLGDVFIPFRPYIWYWPAPTGQFTLNKKWFDGTPYAPAAFTPEATQDAAALAAVNLSGAGLYWYGATVNQAGFNLYQIGVDLSNYYDQRPAVIFPPNPCYARFEPALLVHPQVDTDGSTANLVPGAGDGSVVLTPPPSLPPAAKGINYYFGPYGGTLARAATATDARPVTVAALSPAGAPSPPTSNATRRSPPAPPSAPLPLTASSSAGGSITPGSQSEGQALLYLTWLFPWTDESGNEFTAETPLGAGSLGLNVALQYEIVGPAVEYPAQSITVTLEGGLPAGVTEANVYLHIQGLNGPSAPTAMRVGSVSPSAPTLTVSAIPAVQVSAPTSAQSPVSIADPGVAVVSAPAPGGSLTPGRYDASYAYYDDQGETDHSPLVAPTVISTTSPLNQGVVSLPFADPYTNFGTLTIKRSLPALPAVGLTLPPTPKGDTPPTASQVYAGGLWTGMRFLTATFSGVSGPITLTVTQQSGNVNSYTVRPKSDGTARIDLASPDKNAMPAYGGGMGPALIVPYYQAHAYAGNTEYNVYDRLTATDALDQAAPYKITQLSLSGNAGGGTLTGLTFTDALGCELWADPKWLQQSYTLMTGFGGINYFEDAYTGRVQFLADGMPALAYLLEGTVTTPSAGRAGVPSAGYAAAPSLNDLVNDINALACGWVATLAYSCPVPALADPGVDAAPPYAPAGYGPGGTPAGDMPTSITPDVAPASLLRMPTDYSRSGPLRWPGGSQTFNLQRVVSACTFPVLSRPYTVAGTVIQGGGYEGLALTPTGGAYSGPLTLTHAPATAYPPPQTPAVPPSVTVNCDAVGFFRALNFLPGEAPTLKARQGSVSPKALPTAQPSIVRAFDDVVVVAVPAPGGVANLAPRAGSFYRVGPASDPLTGLPAGLAVWRRDAGPPSAPGGLSEQWDMAANPVTSDPSDAEPSLSMDASGRLRVGFVRTAADNSQQALETYSDDDGRTWSTPA